MLRYYFEDTGDEKQNQRNRELFAGFAIAKSCLREALAGEYARHENRVKGKLKNQKDWEKYMRIRERCAEDEDYGTSLAFLAQCLFLVYKKVHHSD